MVQSALTACASYAIYVNCQPTTAHYFIMEKCVNVHKSPTKNVMMQANIHMKNVNGVDFDTNMSRNMCMKVMFLYIDTKLRIVYKYIYLYHAYCYLHHLCA